MTPEEFKQALQARGLTVTEQQMAQFAQYYRVLVAVNQTMNLTALTQEKDVYLKHFFDSLTLALVYPDLQQRALTVCDVGSGAGFPAIPLKIMFPQLQVTIIDALQKRIRFLEDLVQQLGLTGVTCRHARAEEFAGRRQPTREAFDVVTARAVAKLPVLAEWCLPLTRMGGYFIALKGAQGAAEVTTATKAFSLLGGHFERQIEFELPSTAGQRDIIIVKKTALTPKRYPRKPGMALKQPLGILGEH